MMHFVENIIMALREALSGQVTLLADAVPSVKEHHDEVMSEWISVESDTPPEGLMVICYTKKAGVRVGECWNDDLGFPLFEGRLGEEELLFWMRLPESPLQD